MIKIDTVQFLLGGNMTFTAEIIENILSSSSALSSGRYEIRIGLDVGSGSTKAKGVVFDSYRSSIDKELKSLNVPMGYQKHISQSAGGHTLSEEAQVEGMQKLLDIINSFKHNGIDTIKCAGIATAWARNAYNSSDYTDLLDKFGMHIKTISQKEEGEIGYKVAESKLMSANDNAELVVLDIGGGSFQLTHQGSYDLDVFNGPYGSSNFSKEIRDHVGNHNSFLSTDEVSLAREYAKEHVNFDKVGNDDVKVAGIGQFLNLGIKGLLDKEYVTLTDVKDLISSFSDMTFSEANAQFPKIGSEFMLAEHTNLILLEAIMEAEQVDTIHFVDAKSVDYVMLTESFWDGVEPLNYDAFVELVQTFSDGSNYSAA